MGVKELRSCQGTKGNPEIGYFHTLAGGGKGGGDVTRPRLGASKRQELEPQGRLHPNQGGKAAVGEIPGPAQGNLSDAARRGQPSCDPGDGKEGLPAQACEGCPSVDGEGHQLPLP